MQNNEIAQVFEHIADLMEIRGENRYKILAYRRAAEIIPTLPERLEELTLKELVALQGIGQALAEKIQELNTTGKLTFLEKLEREVPPSLVELLAVPDLGPKKVALFWRQAGVTNMEELEEAARSGRLRALPGMGEKSEARILAGIQTLKSPRQRLPIHQVYPLAEEWVTRLKTCTHIQRAAIAGSLRRMRATIGDLDLVASTDTPREVMDFFLSQNGIRDVASRGEYKTSVHLENGMSMQLWLQPDERFGSLLQFVTGSKAHNVRLREFALKQDLSLSERGFVTRDLKELLCSDEADVYSALGLPLIPPELREDRTEIQAALNNKLPELAGEADMRADLHVDGSPYHQADYLKKMATSAYQRGLSCVCFIIPTQVSGTSPSPTAHDLSGFVAQIERVRNSMKDRITILCGLEVSLPPGNALPSDKEEFPGIDMIMASVVLPQNTSADSLTRQALDAVQHPRVRVVSFQLSAEPGSRYTQDLDWESILKSARQHEVALEISGRHLETTPDEGIIAQAGQLGVRLSLSARASSADDFSALRYSVGYARRAWLSRQLVISTWSPQEIKNWLHLP